MEQQLIFSSILSITKEIEAIQKNKKNAPQGFMYRGIDDLYNDLQPKFAKHGVFIASEVISEQREQRESKNGGLLLWTILKVKFTFYATDGSSVSSTMIGEAMDSGDKGANKAMSIALKYCLFQMFLIPTEDVKNSDPDATVHDVKAKPTTMYNHKELEKNGKPLIKNETLKKLLERVKAGELGVYEKAIEAFSFEKEQRRFLDQALEQSKSQSQLK